MHSKVGADDTEPLLRRPRALRRREEDRKPNRIDERDRFEIHQHSRHSDGGEQVVTQQLHGGEIDLATRHEDDDAGELVAAKLEGSALGRRQGGRVALVPLGLFTSGSPSGYGPPAGSVRPPSLGAMDRYELPA